MEESSASLKRRRLSSKLDEPESGTNTLSVPITNENGSKYESQKILVTVRGRDKNGIVAELTETIARIGGQILDIKAFVVHDNATALVLLESKDKGMDIVKELLYYGKQTGLQLDFDYIADNVVPINPLANSTQHVITIINESTIPTWFLASLLEKMAGMNINIETITRLSEVSLRCLEMVLDIPASVDWQILKADLLSLCKGSATDISLQPEELLRQRKRLVLFEMDYTLIQQDVCLELARLAGPATCSQVQAIMDAAETGHIDFTTSLEQRVALLKGLPTSALATLKSKLNFTQGARTLCAVLKHLGYKLAVISCGFSVFTEYLKAELGLDYAFANTLEVADDRLTGRILGPIVNSQRKADLLTMISQQENITMDQCVAIGNGAVSSVMLASTGLSIVFDAHPVETAANPQHMLLNSRPVSPSDYTTTVQHKSLDKVLYLLGYKDQDIRSLTTSARMPVDMSPRVIDETVSVPTAVAGLQQTIVTMTCKDKPGLFATLARRG